MSSFKKFGIHPFAFLIFVTLVGCQSELDPSDGVQETFLKKYSGQNSESGFNIVQADDGGFITIGYDYGDIPGIRIIKTNKFGEEISNVFESTQYSMVPRLQRLNDGSILATGLYSSDYIKINQDGSIASHNEFNSPFAPVYVYSKPIEGSDGNLYTSYSNGYSQAYSENYVSFLDRSGNEMSWFDLPSEIFNAKIGTFTLASVKVDATLGNTYWFTGDVYHKDPWSWSHPSKTFFARLNPDTTADVKIIDPDDNQSKYTLALVHTKDNKFVSLHSNANWIFGSRFEYAATLDLIKWDESLSVIWRENTKIPGLNYLNPVDLQEMSNGGFLVWGFGYFDGQSDESPFFAEFSSSGKLVFSKTYSFGGASAFFGGGQHREGGYYFTGYVSSYGKGKEFSDQFILRTDNKGNYQAK